MRNYIDRVLLGNVRGHNYYHVFVNFWGLTKRLLEPNYVSANKNLVSQQNPFYIVSAG